MPVEVYINFNGNCREAVEFYAQIFGAGKPQIMTFGDAPPNPEMSMPEEAKSLVMHTELTISGSRVMFSDVFPGTPYTSGNNISLVLNMDNLEEMKSIFNQLKTGGTVIMELQETFWSKGYGYLSDRFGVGWQFNYGSHREGA